MFSQGPFLAGAVTFQTEVPSYKVVGCEPKIGPMHVKSPYPSIRWRGSRSPSDGLRDKAESFSQTLDVFLDDFFGWRYVCMCVCA